jgi:hydantoinase/carbamoylase family amidase
VTLWADIETAAAFTGGDGPGVTRLAWSEPLMALYDWVARRLQPLGFAVSIDAAGNLVARSYGGSGRAVVAGSHLDTVPAGGRFDGALGVLAAVRAAELLRQRDAPLARPLWIVAFMDEEGSRFGASMFGSRAFAGEDVSALLDRRDADGVSVAEAMTAAGADPDRVGEAHALDDVAAYVELHIEQGPVLERSGHDVGAVTAIAGLVRMDVSVTGEANHAGTTPMGMRRDALVAAARAVGEVREAALGAPGEAVATVGTISVAPGSYNVVPGEAVFSIDLRAADMPTLAAVERTIRGALQRIAVEESVTIEVGVVHRLDPTPLDPRLVAAVEDSAARRGARAQRMASGAGHDAMVIGRHRPAAMLFVPSAGGISHNPAERTDEAACELGAVVLADVLAAAAAIDWEGRSAPPACNNSVDIIK